MSLSQFRKFRRQKNKDIEPQEVLLDDFARKREEEFGVSEKRFEIPLSRNSAIIFMTIFFAMFFSLILRSGQLQIVQGEKFANIAERNQTTITSMQLLRGVIYDRNMNQLTHNSPQFELYFQKDDLFLKDRESLWKVAEIIGLERNEVLEKIEDSTTQQVLIKRDLDHDEMVLLQAGIVNFPGFSISSNVGREYKDGSVFSHILGYIGKVDRETMERNLGKYNIHDYSGKTGIEKFYEEKLTRGGMRIETKYDASRKVTSEEVIEEGEGSYNLVLTIDGDLQRFITEKTNEKLEEIGAKKAAVVALNPQTGEVLSMVSIPSFDNNIFKKGADPKDLEALLKEEGIFINRAVSATYSPGSIIKPLLAVAALEEKIITPDKKIYSPGYISIENPWDSSNPIVFRDYEAHGWTNIMEAIAVSSNVYFYSIGGGYENQEGLGVSRIKKYLELFGWGDNSGVDLPNEKKGQVPSPDWKMDNFGEMWRIGDTYNLSIGQGYLSTTPLQVAVSYSALVNGGKIISPYLLKKTLNDKGEVISKTESKIIRENFVSPESLETVKEGMKMTTTIGTARSLGNLPFEVGAKTGTTQISKPGHFHNWITVFAPYEEPEIVITLIVEEVEGVQAVSGPLALDILKWYFSEE